MDFSHLKNSRRLLILKKWSDSERVTLEVSALSSDGTGISRTDRGVVFVQGALPGEIVNAKIVSRKKDFMIADTISVERHSSGRVNPKCRYYGKCGGCQLQHASYDSQLKLKAELVRDAMTRIGGFERKSFDELVCEPSPSSWGYRNKAAFPVQDINGRIMTGFYRAGTHRLELIRNCPVNAEKINFMYKNILDSLGRLNITGYDERSHTGKLRHIISRTGMNTGDTLLSFVINGKISQKGMKSLASMVNASTVTLNYNSKPGNVILGTYTENLKGSGLITERLGNFVLSFDTASFFQVNTGQAEKLFSYASSQIESAKNVLELYSGTGSLTCYLARSAKYVTSVEEFRGAVHMAVRNLKANGFDNVHALCGRSEEVIADLKDSYDCAVLDPPRDGCAKSVIEAINNFGVKRIVYVSCNPATLARDCKIFSSHGYNLVSIRAFDMFPQTAHVETVVVLMH